MPKAVTVELYDVQTQWLELIQLVRAGNEVLLTEAQHGFAPALAKAFCGRLQGDDLPKYTDDLQQPPADIRRASGALPSQSA